MACAGCSDRIDYEDEGVEPVVMCPQRLDERCKRVNTDKRDCRAIASRLDRFLAGNEEALVKARISSEQQNQGSITKTGNPRCRHALIELAWRALQFQPDYWVVKKFKPRIDKTKERSVARKKLIVAMARLIGVDLWRLYTGQTTLAKLGLRAKTGKDYVLENV